MPGSKVTDDILDVKDDLLKYGGKMFTYLVTCPTKGATLLKRVFQQQQVSGIFISMKRILEKSSDQDLVDSGKYVLNELMSTLEFQYVTKLDNSTFRKTKNPTDVKGKLGWESIRSSPRDGFGDLGFMLKMVDYPRSFLLLST